MSPAVDICRIGDTGREGNGVANLEESGDTPYGSGHSFISHGRLFCLRIGVWAREGARAVKYRVKKRGCLCRKLGRKKKWYHDNPTRRFK